MCVLEYTVYVMVIVRGWEVAVMVIACGWGGIVVGDYECSTHQLLTPFGLCWERSESISVQHPQPCAVSFHQGFSLTSRTCPRLLL